MDLKLFDNFIELIIKLKKFIQEHSHEATIKV